jgi:site-specific DNA-methyltransferase (adenine-specific)
VSFLNAYVAEGWQLHQELVWVKDTMVLGHSDYHYQHEPILYGWTKGPGRSGRGKHEGTRWYGPHNAVSVFDIPRPKASLDHPTGKPVELVLGMLANSTAQSQAVYEPFSGSGTTIIAAEQLGRRCYAMEIDPRYVQVAIERWQAFTGKEAQRET